MLGKVRTLLERADVILSNMLGDECIDGLDGWYTLDFYDY